MARSERDEAIPMELRTNQEIASSLALLAMTNQPTFKPASSPTVTGFNGARMR